MTSQKHMTRVTKRQAQHICYLVSTESDLEVQLRQIGNKEHVVWINGVFIWSEDDWNRLKHELINEARRVTYA